MELLSEETGSSLVASAVSRYLDRGEAGGLNYAQLADLINVSRVTIYKWRDVPAKRGAIRAVTFLNILIATQRIETALRDGMLPPVSRRQGNTWVRRVWHKEDAPE